MCLLIKENKREISQFLCFFKNLCRECRTWVGPWKMSIVYPGEDKNRDTGAEHTCASVRASLKDEGPEDVLESYAGR